MQSSHLPSHSSQYVTSQVISRFCNSINGSIAVLRKQVLGLLFVQNTKDNPGFPFLAALPISCTNRAGSLGCFMCITTGMYGASNPNPNHTVAIRILMIMPSFLNSEQIKDFVSSSVSAQYVCIIHVSLRFSNPTYAFPLHSDCSFP